MRTVLAEHELVIGQQLPKYRELIYIAGEVVRQASEVLVTTEATPGIVAVRAPAIQRLRSQITHYCDLGERVIDQARRRVLEGEQVPNDEKIFSIFSGLWRDGRHRRT